MSAYTTKSAALALVAALAVPASAFWRMPCPGRLVLERIDPIISPGVVSGHVHTVSGGSGFGFTTDYAQQRASACSSCPIKQDLSAYWTPKLYYMGPNGSYFEDVPQAGEGPGTTAGLTVYYEQRGNISQANPPLAFPENFRMVAGDPFQRNYTGALSAPGQAVNFACLNYNGPEPPQTNDMPNYNCPDGLRMQVYFPSCWDGKHTDSVDHKSHVAYPLGHVDNGVCPDSHPVQLISIFYEVIYQTNLYVDRWHSPLHHPFVFAMGDRTGYGFHGDFVNGWDVEALQSAINNCTNDSGKLSDCPVFDDLFSDDECQACKIPPSIDEQVTGNISDKLPGCNPVTNGPAYAPPPVCDNPSISAPTEYFTNEVTSLGWEYQGCANDSVSERTFQGASTSSDSMTIESCINYCKGEGFSLAGLEYASQCFCDNDYPNYTDDSRVPQPNILGDCWQPCAGNADQICGGGSALSVYKNCDGGACTNSLFAINGTTTSSRKSKRHTHRHAHGHAKLH